MRDWSWGKGRTRKAPSVLRTSPSMRETRKKRKFPLLEGEKTIINKVKGRLTPKLTPELISFTGERYFEN